MWKVIWFAFIASVLYARVYINRFIRWLFGMGRQKVRVAPWRVVRAYLIREPPVEVTGGEPYDWDFLDITGHTEYIDYKDAGWKQRLARVVPEEWDAWRVEIRCERGAMKRRLVVRSTDDEDMQFPEECKGASNRRVIQGHGVLLGATLAVPGGEYVDITDRVKKYVIHPERRLLPRDLFPLDDVQSLISDNKVMKLHILYLNGTAKTVTLRFDDEMADLSKLFYMV